MLFYCRPLKFNLTKSYATRINKYCVTCVCLYFFPTCFYRYNQTSGRSFSSKMRTLKLLRYVCHTCHKTNNLVNDTIHNFGVPERPPSRRPKFVRGKQNVNKYDILKKSVFSDGACSLSTTWNHTGVEVQLHSFWTLATRWSKWVTSQPDQFTRGKEPRLPLEGSPRGPP